MTSPLAELTEAHVAQFESAHWRGETQRACHWHWTVEEIATVEATPVEPPVVALADPLALGVSTVVGAHTADWKVWLGSPQVVGAVPEH